MKDNTKFALIIVVLAVAAYVVYQQMLQGKAPGQTSVSLGTTTGNTATNTNTVSTTTTTKDVPIYVAPIYVPPYYTTSHAPQTAQDGIV